MVEGLGHKVQYLIADFTSLSKNEDSRIPTLITNRLFTFYFDGQTYRIVLVLVLEVRNQLNMSLEQISVSS